MIPSAVSGFGRTRLIDCQQRNLFFVQASPERRGVVDELDAHLVCPAGVRLSEPYDTAADGFGTFVVKNDHAPLEIWAGRQQERAVSIDDGRQGIYRRTVPVCQTHGNTGKDARASPIRRWLHDSPRGKCGNRA